MASFSDNGSPSREAQVAAVLARMVAEHGREIVADPRRVDGLLRDHCPEARREVNLLLAALREGVPGELAAYVGSATPPPMALLVPRLVGRLEQEQGMAAAAAQWSVEAWASALGLVLRPSAPAVPTPQQRQAASAALVSLWTDANGDWDEVKAAAMTAETIRTALDAGADVEAHDKFGWTVLMFAAKCGQPEAMRVLLEAGADVNAGSEWDWTALISAAAFGRTEAVRLLLKAGADVEARRDKDGGTALMSAAQGGKMEIIHLLIEAGADVNAGDKWGWTALGLAASEGETEAMRLLLGAGVDVNATENGWTVLMWAAKYSQPEAVRLLLEAGADVNATDQEARTALWHAQNPAEDVPEEAKARVVAVLMSLSR